MRVDAERPVVNKNVCNSTKRVKNADRKWVFWNQAIGDVDYTAVNVRADVVADVCGGFEVTAGPAYTSICISIYASPRGMLVDCAYHHHGN